MLEKYIHILIVNEDLIEAELLNSMLQHRSHIIHIANSGYQALNILKEKEIAIVISPAKMNRMDGIDFIKAIQNNNSTTQRFGIVTTNPDEVDEKIMALNSGAVDFIDKPFNINIVKSKVNVYKKLYFNQQRILQLLRNVLPQNILSEFYKYGKSSPKRYENGIVLFTDFVNFSSHSAKAEPIKLIKRLDTYFKKFDEIIGKYDLEKIKTIGDAYMVVGGLKKEVTTTDYMSMALAAIEMRDYVRTEEITSRAFQEPVWQMRMGIHSGPLVAGVIGNKKFSFDVWGDTVNIASRAEESCLAGQLFATKDFTKQISSYFNLESEGTLEIRKRGGFYDILKITGLKKEFSLFGDGKSPDKSMRKEIGLPSVDFDNARTAIINKLKSGLDDTLVYHSLEHCLFVESSIVKFAKLENVNENDLMLLRTAALFHDSGFLVQYEHNEKMGVLIMKSMLPSYGYSRVQIKTIEDIIMATSRGIQPETILQKLICDADHDYLGRPEYHSVARKLRKELDSHGKKFEERDWIEFQLNYLENKHQYYTKTATNLREKGKQLRIIELKKMLEEMSEVKP